MAYFVCYVQEGATSLMRSLAAAMRWLFLILLPIILPLLTQAQRPFNDDYFLFESSDAVKTNAMVQDEVGFMWLGTEIGLYRFNGQGDLTPIYDTLHSPVTAL